MITVLQLCEHFGGRESSLHGVARGFQWWIPAFDKNRFRVLLCSRKGRDRAAEQMEAAGLKPVYLGYGKMNPLNLLKLIGIIKKEKVDVIHAHGYGACTWGRLAGMVLNIPVIVHERCNYVTVPWFQRPVERLLGPRTRYAYAVSESSREFCIKKRYMRPEVVEVLYHGILMDDIHQVDASWVKALKEERGLTSADKIVGIVGRLESHKGHIDAFKALKIVLGKEQGVHLWIAGDGAYGPHLAQWVEDNGLKDHVDFLGFRKDIRKVIQCFDVQLFPSHMEGTPNTLYEAMAVGNAVVASTADGQGEILENGDTALMFEPGDHEKMATHLLRVIGDPDLRARLAKRARERSSDFDGRKAIARMQSKYEEIVGKR